MCGVKMMPLHHDWAGQPPQPLLPASMLDITKFLHTLICCFGAYGSSLKRYTHTTWVRYMSSGSLLESTWSHYVMVEADSQVIRHIQSVWAHWYAIHGHLTVASNSYAHTTWLIFWGSGSLVESRWCHYVMVEADRRLKLPLASILDVYNMFEHIDIPFMGMWQYPQIVTPTLFGSDFGVLDHLWSQNNVITSWLKLTTNSNCFLHPH